MTQPEGSTLSGTLRAWWYAAEKPTPFHTYEKVSILDWRLDGQPLSAVLSAYENKPVKITIEPL